MLSILLISMGSVLTESHVSSSVILLNLDSFPITDDRTAPLSEGEDPPLSYINPRG